MALQVLGVVYVSKYLNTYGSKFGQGDFVLNLDMVRDMTYLKHIPHLKKHIQLFFARIYIHKSFQVDLIASTTYIFIFTQFFSISYTISCPLFLF